MWDLVDSREVSAVLEMSQPNCDQVVAATVIPGRGGFINSLEISKRSCYLLLYRYSLMISVEACSSVRCQRNSRDSLQLWTSWGMALLEEITCCLSCYLSL